MALMCGFYADTRALESSWEAEKSRSSLAASPHACGQSMGNRHSDRTGQAVKPPGQVQRNMGWGLACHTLSPVDTHVTVAVTKLWQDQAILAPK